MTTSLVDKQRRSFDQLVEAGVYSEDFEHAPAAKDFVGAVLAQAMPQPAPGRPLTVLDCGCGTGVWLAFLASTLRQVGIAEVRLCGFDLSGKMVEVARRRLAGLAEAKDLRAGNLLESSSYDFDGIPAGFDLIFAYDVVQQLPRRDQYAACELMASRLALGGSALVFDNDSRSKFGRRMARRKFFTRYFGLNLVPRYYCNASYPPLEQYRRRLAAASWNTAIHIRPDQVKRALVLTARHRGEPDQTTRRPS
jgi:SAM-dependent methyltransferase